MWRNLLSRIPVCARFLTIIPGLDGYGSSDEEEVSPAPLPQKRKRIRISYADKKSFTRSAAEILY